MAWAVLNAEHHGVHIEDLLEETFAEANPTQQERSFALELAHGVTRWRLKLDYIITNLVSDPSRAIPRDLRNLLRLGLYQIFFLDRVPAHAAVDLTVEMAKIREVANVAGFVNALLRRALREKDSISFPDPQREPAKYLSVSFSHPLWLIERWLARFGFDATKGFCEWNNKPPSVYLKANLRKTTVEALRLELKQAGIETGEPKGAHIPLHKPGRIGDIASVKDGRAYVQDPASGLVVDLMGVAQEERIADLCSAPGGKAAGIAERIGKGILVAADLDSGRLQIMAENMRRLEVRATLFVMDARKPALRPNQFDAVLLDAPCSNTGVLSRKSESRWQKNKEDLVRLSKMQSEMLSAASGLVKAGGRLVYSTCSLEPEEDHLVVEAFLRSHPQFVLEPAREFVPVEFDRDGYLQVLPWVHHMDGMFGARLRRKI